ncbi:hypothetical protein CEXT_18311 [Caerostris extrusa]|uniref:Uncharacterized protein n=1 Tax=Caerostris extrusa TaxID=172846 RepID=A0AAV4W1V8_CAEEX|nr:hypothetical protein CEXT_18311 [Caerostris extrusa]
MEIYLQPDSMEGFEGGGIVVIKPPCSEGIQNGLFTLLSLPAERARGKSDAFLVHRWAIEVCVTWRISDEKHEFKSGH